MILSKPSQTCMYIFPTYDYDSPIFLRSISTFDHDASGNPYSKSQSRKPELDPWFWGLLDILFPLISQEANCVTVLMPIHSPMMRMIIPLNLRLSGANKVILPSETFCLEVSQRASSLERIMPIAPHVASEKASHSSKQVASTATERSFISVYKELLLSNISISVSCAALYT